MSGIKKWLTDQENDAARQISLAHSRGFSPSSFLKLNFQIPLGSELRKLSYDQLQHEHENLRNALDAMRKGETEAFNGLDSRFRHLAISQALTRDRQIRGAMEQLETQEQMSEIQGAVEAKVKDAEVRNELAELIAEMKQEQADRAERRQLEDDDHSRAMRKLDISERKWEMRKSMLNREPAAVLVGGLLLLLITCALIAAMFFNTDVPEIVASGFLLILGFFFGQNSSRVDSSGDSN